MKRIKNSNKGYTLTEVLLVLAIIAILSFAFLRGLMVDQEQAVKALTRHGYTDIRITDKDTLTHGLRGGNMLTAASFTAEAKNPQGQAVIVYVNVDWPGSGATIRLK